MKTTRKPKPQKPEEPKRGRGRPTLYTQEAADAVCAGIASGKTLRELCRDEGMPNEATVRLWVIDDREGFSAQYTRARALQLEVWAEEIITISDDGTKDTLKGGKVDHENVNRARLRTDNRKWLLSKLHPERYGDRLEVKSTNLNVNLTDEQLNHKIAQLQGQVGAGELAGGEGASDQPTTH